MGPLSPDPFRVVMSRICIKFRHLISILPPSSKHLCFELELFISPSEGAQ